MLTTRIVRGAGWQRCLEDYFGAACFCLHGICYYYLLESSCEDRVVPYSIRLELIQHHKQFRELEPLA